MQNKVFNFFLTQEQAQKVLERAFDSYKKYVSQYISDSLLRCSQEKASLVSLHYHGRLNNIKNSVRNSIIKNSRFLSWFLIRYKTNPRSFIPFLVRACDEADIYLSNSNTNKINLIFDIFSYLNIKKEMIEYRIHEVKTNRTNSKQAYKQYTLYGLALWYENDLNFIPYQDYIADLKTFQKLKSISQLTEMILKILLHCLLYLPQIKENIDNYSIEQTKNTFLSIVVFEGGAKLDMSKIDTEKFEILYARLKDENTIEVIHLQGSHKSMTLDSTANTLAIKENSNETYIFDKAKKLRKNLKSHPFLKFIWIKKQILIFI